jgi:hypothetical protein
MFLLLWSTAERGWNWTNDSDWSTGMENVRAVARIVKANHLGGLVFDTEAYDKYGHSLWDPGDHGGLDAKAKENARSRGRQFIEAIQQELPSATILLTYGVSIFRGAPGADTPREAVTRAYDGKYSLLPDFLAGMLQAAGTGARIIDGNERSYYYDSEQQFEAARWDLRSLWQSMILQQPETTLDRRVQVCAGVFLDQVMGERPSPKTMVSYYLSPADKLRFLESNVYWALLTSDELVWIYSENSRLSTAVLDAVRIARDKARTGRPLGFSIDAAIAEATAKFRAARVKGFH